MCGAIYQYVRTGRQRQQAARSHQFMAHDSTANNGVGALEGDLNIGDVDIGDAICTRRDIAQVTCVALLVSRGAMSLARWVEVWAGGEAAVGSVSELRERYG